MNWVLPIRLEPAKEGDIEYVALRHQLLPRVPIAGEWVDVPRYRAVVERVQWTADGRVTARLQETTVDGGYLDELEQAGWETFPRQDADEWLTELKPG